MYIYVYLYIFIYNRELKARKNMQFKNIALSTGEVLQYKVKNICLNNVKGQLLKCKEFK